METLGQLAGSVAHDFNNLLTAIRGFAEMAAATLGPDHDVGPDLAEIQGAADRAADLTTRLLAFSRQSPADSSVVALNPVVEGMGAMLRRLIGPTVNLRIALDPEVGHVRIDRPQLEQAVLNLVVNARDAMPGGGAITIATRHERIDGGANDGDRQVAVITVADTGVGMTPDVAERAFEPFFSTKKSGEGTGLGLAIVFGAVRNADGEISIESSPGSGSTFRIVLPSVLSPDDAVAEAAPSPPTGGTESILLVEDEAAIRSFASRILTRHGYDVVSADNAEAAIAVHAPNAGRFGLLLSDVTMPGRSGPALAEELRASDPSLRVLFMSGFVPGGRGPTLPADTSFLHKPFSVEELLRAVRSALDQEPDQSEREAVGTS
jgi:CheY-like chemotaxis protein